MLVTDSWRIDELEHIARAEELEIAAQRADRTSRAWLTIWVVTVDDEVYVRTWHRRGNGWYGDVLDTRRARIRVPNLERDVGVEDIGSVDEQLRASIDAAYKSKYGPFGWETVDRMTDDDAAATTLRLMPSTAP
jgi:hypothetical protein